MAEYVLDTVVLQVMSFAAPDGITILLEGLAAPNARFPAEVYNRDEATFPLGVPDSDLSEFARGLRYAARQVRVLPSSVAERYQTWLSNAAQLTGHLEEGRLVVDPLTIEELAQREDLVMEYGIGRGEAACLTLVERYRAVGIFLSSDEEACTVARKLGLAYLTLPEIVEAWARQKQPARNRLENLISGMRAAKFGLKPDVLARLRDIVEDSE